MTGAFFLHNVSLFANLSTSEMEALAQRLVVRKIRSGEHIFSQGSPGNSMYIVKSGLVDIVLTNAEGQAQVLAQFGQGQAFGDFALLDGLPRSAGAVACEKGELLVLTRPEFFMYLEQHPAVAINLLVLLSRRLRFALQGAEHEDQTVCPPVQLARILLKFAERYGYVEDGKTHIAIRLTRGELAGIMGCPRSNADSAVETLEEKGLVEIRGLQVAIADLDKLRALASEQD